MRISSIFSLRRTALLWLSGLCLGLSGLVSAADPEPLPPQEAFKLAAPTFDGKTLTLTYTVAPGYYLYGNKFSFQLDPPATLGAPQLPPGQVKDDQYMGRVETYRNTLTLKIPVNGTIEAGKTKVIAKSQGCADFGLCYPPYTWKLPVVAASSVGDSDTSKGSGLFGEILKKKNSDDAVSSSGDTELNGLLQGRKWGAIVLTFGLLGLGLSLTACLYPLIPIISGIILAGGHSRSRGFWLSLLYAQGVAVTYALAGILAGFTGTMLSQALQTPLMLGLFSALFVLLALAMFGVFQLQLPSGVQSRLNAAANRLPGGKGVTVFLMGVLSAIIIGPCMAPPLAAALLYIGQTGDALTGGVALYALGVGLGLPLIAVGVFGGSLLPHAGPWMNQVRRVYGVILLALALWIAHPILPAGAVMLAWSALLFGCAVLLRAIDPLPVHAHTLQRLGKALGLAMLTVAVALLIGWLAGQRDPLQPLKQWSPASAGAPAGTRTNFEKIAEPDRLRARLAEVKGRPALVDVYADWCIACHELDRETFADPAVAHALSGFAAFKLDMTANSEAQRQWLQEHQLFGPPAILLFDGQGVLRKTLIGFQSPAQLLAALKDIA